MNERETYEEYCKIMGRDFIDFKRRIWKLQREKDALHFHLQHLMTADRRTPMAMEEAGIIMIGDTQWIVPKELKDEFDKLKQETPDEQNNQR